MICYLPVSLLLGFVGAQVEDDFNRYGADASIIGNVPPNTYSWFAQGTSDKVDIIDWSGCSGALISDEWVLAAAHCAGYTTGFRIGALCHPFENGESGENNCNQYTESFKNQKTVVHPLRNRYPTGDHDFALFKLDGISAITPVPLDGWDARSTAVDDDETLAQGQKLQAIGLGGHPARLKQVEVSYITNKSCCTDHLYECHWLTDNKMCAFGGRGKDACYGDSGGPLYDGENNRLVGVNSFSPMNTCGLGRHPGVYARVSAQVEWIRSIVCNDSENIPDWCNAVQFPACNQKRSHEFFKGGKVAIKTCDWLRKVSRKQRDRICKKTERVGEYSTPSEVCCKVCK